MTARDRLESVLVHAVLIAACAFSLYPVVWVVSLALSPRGLSTSAALLPSTEAPSLANFETLLGSPLFLRQMVSSIVVSVATAVVAIGVSTPAAYALARFRSRLVMPSLRGLMATQMFPAIGTAVPLYMLLRALHLLDTRAGLVLVYAATAIPFAVFQLRGAFMTIPEALEEAAMVDGATRLQAFLRVVLPAARPAISVTALFAFMSAWNEFILAATFLGREDAYTLPVVLQRFVGEHGTSWGLFAAGSIVVSLPVMTIFYFAQRHLVSGLTAGGVKG
jgi:arabinogalactan oligomer/maltooligosaccharide transport system permease protein